MSRAGLVVPPVRRATGVRFVWHLCDGTSSRAVGPLTRFADACTCVSRMVLRQFARRSRTNIRLLYTGVWADERELDGLAAARGVIRQELGLSLGTPVVGLVSNLQLWKGVHVVIRAMAEVVRAIPDAVLVHIGGRVPGYESYEREITSLISELDLTRTVRRLGYQPDALRFFPAFDVYAHAPIFENGCTEAFGHSLVEAMAHRLPVVTSNVGGPAEIVKAGETGELIEPGDRAALAAYLIELLRDPERRRIMGAAGYRRYKAFFTQEREEREYEALYAELLNRPDLAPAGEVVRSEWIS